MRQIIISVIGIIIIALGFFGMQQMANREKPVRKKEKRAVPYVFTEYVKNTSSPISIIASGNLAARDRVELYAEVQGIFDYSEKSFKPGIYYNSGSILLQINSDEHRANLRAQKSSLYNQIVALLPDLKFDYADAFDKWQTYVNDFSAEQSLKKLPEPKSDKEKLFIAGRNINSVWYTVKNLEERLAKYVIYAPYDGILTEANVDKGVLIRPGQKLGEFINPYVYELEVAVNSSYADLLKRGNEVTLSNVEKTNTWKGKVNRINSLIDPNTQTLQAYITVNGKGLREGMYLEAVLTAKEEKNTYEIPRKLLVDNDKVFVLEGEILKSQKIEAVHFTDTKAVIRGLADSTEILSKMLPGAYDGMRVQKYEE